MKARLVPLYFDPGRDDDFAVQLEALRSLLADVVDLLEPVDLGASLPEADAVVFPQLLGQAYRQAGAFRAIDLPILFITSEFGTLSMWDWEIAEYLGSCGVETIAPYNLEQTKRICAALGVKRELKNTKFLVYQDDPGEGFQAAIFKRFYWWEPENHILVAHCGYMGVVPKSFATEWTLRKKVLAIVDENATAIDARLPTGEVTLAKLHSGMDKMTVAEGMLRSYVQFPGSDCLNGGVIRVRDGRALMDALASHHYLLLVGHHLAAIRFLGKVFGLEIEEI